MPAATRRRARPAPRTVRAASRSAAAHRRPSRLRMLRRAFGERLARGAARTKGWFSDRLIGFGLPVMEREIHMREVADILREGYDLPRKILDELSGRRPKLERAVQERIMEEMQYAQELFEAVGEERIRQLGIPPDFNLANPAHYNLWEKYIMPRLERDAAMMQYRLIPGAAEDERRFDKIVSQSRRGMSHVEREKLAREAGTPLDRYYRTEFARQHGRKREGARR